MNDETTTDHAQMTTERDEPVFKVESCRPIVVRLHVSEVSNVPNGIIGSTMRLVERIKVSAGGIAAAAEVAKCVDMEATLCVCSEALDCAGDFHFGVRLVLLEVDCSGNTRRPSQHGDGLDRSVVRRCIGYKCEADEELDEVRDGRTRVHGEDFWGCGSNRVSTSVIFIYALHCLVDAMLGK